jgi:D-lactate dehydrogenase (cytochrome)
VSLDREGDARSTRNAQHPPASKRSTVCVDATIMATLTLQRPDSLGDDLPVCTDPDVLATLRRDAAAMHGSGAAGLIEPRSTEQLARWLRDNPTTPLLAQGALTSLTGGATPDGDVVVSLRRMTQLRVSDSGENVQADAGVVLANLQQALADRGLYYPPAPTHDGATIGGNVSTNAAGAATFKYGTTRDWVNRIRMVLRNGDVLALRRGDHIVRAAEVLRFEGSRTFELRMPVYESPAIKKSSAGYFARSPMDLIDLFIGSEGTLGFITEAELRVVPRPRVVTGLVFASRIDRAIALVGELRERSEATRRGDRLDGLDVRSIELFDRRCLELLREENKLREHAVDVPESAVACLLFEQEVALSWSDDAIVDQLVAAGEGASAQRNPIGDLMDVLRRFDVVEATEIALPSDARRQRQLAAIREAIPLSISDWLVRRQKDHPEVHKVAGDMTVPFERFEEMLGCYGEAFRARGVDVAVFGHISDGNVHPNALPRDARDMRQAKEALLSLAAKAKSMGGCPLSEHGVGKHPLKKAMLAQFWGDDAISQMRGVKRAFDPTWTLGRGVFFDP